MSECFNNVLLKMENIFAKKFQGFIKIEPGIGYNYTLDDFEKNITRSQTK
jgi:hypothetical protein